MAKTTQEYADAYRLIAKIIELDIDMNDYHVATPVVDAIYKICDDLHEKADDIDGGE